MTTKPIPKWIQLRYATLLKKFGLNEFTLDEAIPVLAEKKEVCVVILSNLRRHGWLKLILDEYDARKKIYTLIKPEDVILKMNKLGDKNE